VVNGQGQQLRAQSRYLIATPRIVYICRLFLVLPSHFIGKIKLPFVFLFCIFTRLFITVMTIRTETGFKQVVITLNFRKQLFKKTVCLLITMQWLYIQAYVIDTRTLSNMDTANNILQQLLSRIVSAT